MKARVGIGKEFLRCRCFGKSRGVDPRPIDRGAATPAITAVVASLLKTIPGAGTIAGGFLQGIVQALITRWIGAVFIEYFRNEMQQTSSSLTAMARDQWQRLTTVDELRKLLQSARKHLNEDEG